MPSVHFAGLTVREARASLGVNGAGRSELRLSLVKDAGDSPSFPAPQTPAYFTLGGFTFSGLLQSSNETSISIDGMPVYNAVITDPAEVLDAVTLITEGYIGTAPVNNVMNVFGYWETLFGFGGAGNNESGTLWSRIVSAVNIFANGVAVSPYGSRINYRGVTYSVDLSAMPTMPTDYRVSCNGNSLLDVISQVCRDAGFEFFITLNTLTLTVNTINRNASPVSGAAAAFLAGSAFSGILSRCQIGQEGTTVSTATVLTGGYQNGLFISSTIASYWGEDNTGVPILGTPFVHPDLPTEPAEQMTLPADEVAGLIASTTYTTNTIELRAALHGPDMWKLYISKYKPALAPFLDVIFKPGAGLNVVKGDLINDGRLPVLNAINLDLQAASNQLYLYVRKWAEEFYGRKFLVRIPDVDVKIPLSGDTEPTFSHAVDTAGYVEGGASTIMPAVAELKFTDSNGRVLPYASIPAATSADAGGFDPTNSVISGGALVTRIDVSPRIRIVGTQAGVVITLPQPVFARSQLDGGSPLAIINGVGPGLKRNGAFGNLPVAIYPAALYPSVAGIGLRSNRELYGPWYAQGAQGKVEYHQDPSLVPWNYGSMSALNTAATLQVASAISSQTHQETLDIVVVGTPVYNFGQLAGAGGPSLTDVNIEYGINGFTTNYRFKSFTPRAPLGGSYVRQQLDLMRRNASAADDARNKALRNEAKATINAEAFKRAIAARAFRANLAAWQRRESPHETFVSRVLQVSNTDYRVGVSTATQEECLSLLNADSDTDYVDSAAMSLNGLLRPFRIAESTSFTTTSTSNMPLATYDSGDEQGAVLTAGSLMPFRPSNDIEAGTWGPTYEGFNTRLRQPDATGDYEFRTLGLRGPVMMVGWGMGIDGVHYPTGATTGEYATSYRTRSPSWKAGPMDPLWDPARGVWTSHDVYSGIVSHDIDSGEIGTMHVTILGTSTTISVPVRNLSADTATGGTDLRFADYVADRGEFVLRELQTSPSSGSGSGSGSHSGSASGSTSGSSSGSTSGSSGDSGSSGSGISGTREYQVGMACNPAGSGFILYFITEDLATREIVSTRTATLGCCGCGSCGSCGSGSSGSSGYSGSMISGSSVSGATGLTGIADSGSTGSGGSSGSGSTVSVCGMTLPTIISVTVSGGGGSYAATWTGSYYDTGSIIIPGCGQIHLHLSCSGGVWSMTPITDTVRSIDTVMICTLALSTAGTAPILLTAGGGLSVSFTATFSGCGCSDTRTFTWTD